jgi:hypothetical protein
MSDDDPLFEVVTPAASAAARRLTTAAYVAATMSAPPSNAILEAYIDEVSAKAADFCSLARDSIGSVPTFAAETVRATWFITDGRDSELLLPWRVPVTSISSVVEDGLTLTANTDYRLMGAGVLLRLSSDVPIPWSSGKIVVVYVAGWAATLSTNAPADLQAAVAEQVKYRAWARDRDPGLRSESEPDVYSASYAIAGGDNVGESGMLVQVESALNTYRRVPL